MPPKKTSPAAKSTQSERGQGTPKKLTQKEQLALEREARHKLIQSASGGNKDALKKLAGAPYHLRVYTPEEREAYIKEHGR
ncbi:MAG: hypothetical protein QGI83_11165 [Candidatus Latescibacteria bacterium]|jgi:hypothetical protein|nr:hypothetical protein [Candidatus Latescibacterota bacterium]